LLKAARRGGFWSEARVGSVGWVSGGGDAAVPEHRVRFKVMRRFANRQRVGKWQRRHSASGCYWQFLRRPLKFACRFASIVITVANSEENLKEAAVIETSRIAKVRSVSASLWIAPPEHHLDHSGIDTIYQKIQGLARSLVPLFSTTAIRSKLPTTRLPSGPKRLLPCLDRGGAAIRASAAPDSLVWPRGRSQDVAIGCAGWRLPRLDIACDQASRSLRGIERSIGNGTIWSR
jgi:hypothetical protein